MIETKEKDIAQTQLKHCLTPKEIVLELDRYIVGQNDAKKAVAIALRNRDRRKVVDGSLRDEIVPKNILMVGPTGVGKTEIARRLAKLSNAPFIKVEATKFTEIGYVGRDVESVIRDLMEIAIKEVREKTIKKQQKKAREHAYERILNILVGDSPSEGTKEKFMEMLKTNQLDDKEIEIKIKDKKSSKMPTFDVPGMPGAHMGLVNLSDILNKAAGAEEKLKNKKTTVKEAAKLLEQEEAEKLLDEEKLVEDAIFLVENDGIVFIDELDKICSRENVRGGDVSREGVQRDFLPLIEGTTVNTKYGPVKTTHILFITSGAFHLSKPSDLLPELQGRLPIRVELKDLSKEDMVRILVEPEASLIKQYTALLNTERVTLEFTDGAIEEIADIATNLNKEVENIGARRLHTIIEKLLEEISFTAPEKKNTHLLIDKNYVEERLSGIKKQTDFSKFIL